MPPSSSAWPTSWPTCSARGDAAVLDYTPLRRLLRRLMAALELTQAELKAAFDALPEAAQREACRRRPAACAATTRRRKRPRARAGATATKTARLLGQKVTPLDRVGIYVPGGKAAYPSSVLMNAIPAHVAGVGEIIMVVPTPVAVWRRAPRHPPR
jgi:histidinol dehydrogenase